LLMYSDIFRFTPPSSKMFFVPSLYRKRKSNCGRGDNPVVINLRRSSQNRQQ
jgi:hypothetical protein